MHYSTKSELDRLTYEIVGAAIHVHKSLGPGLSESVYHECLKIALADRNISFETELQVPILFDGRVVDAHLRCDLLVNNAIVVELKSVSEIHQVYEAQLLTYMKLMEKPKGILINFNCRHLFSEGQKTFVNEFYRQLQD